MRTTKYSLPRSLHEHVDVVQPTNYFGNTKALGTSPFGMGDWKSGGWHHSYPPGEGSQNLSAVCNETAVTNLCLRTLYRTVDYVPRVPEKNYVATTNYLNQTANYSDFHIFMSQQRKDADPSYEYTYQIIANGTNNQNMEPLEALEMGLDLEANQDVQVTHPSPTPNPTLPSYPLLISPAKDRRRLRLPHPLHNLLHRRPLPGLHARPRIPHQRQRALPYLAILRSRPNRPPLRHQHLLRRR